MGEEALQSFTPPLVPSRQTRGTMHETPAEEGPARRRLPDRFPPHETRCRISMRKYLILTY